MNLIDFLERRFGRFAIPGLVRIIVALNVVVFVLGHLNPEFLAAIDLNKAAIEQGELWRLVTYIFIPRTMSYIWFFFAVSILWMVGEGLERVWGAFRLNLYVLVGMIGTTAAAFFFGQNFSNAMLNSSLWFAFAWFFGDMQITLWFIIPVKIRWAAWASAAFLIFAFINGSASLRMAFLASMANYLLFFGPEIVKRARLTQKVAMRRFEFKAAQAPVDEPLHRCVVCRRSEQSNPELEFRVGRDGNDYCMEHLPKATGK